MVNLIDKAVNVQAQQATRALRAVRDTSALALRPPRAEMVFEGLDLATETVKRSALMQRSWARDWGEWGRYCFSVWGVDTFPKLTARSNNVFLQAQAQVLSQANDLSELCENVGVSLAYWIHQQAEKARQCAEAQGVMPPAPHLEEEAIAAMAANTDAATVDGAASVKDTVKDTGAAA